MKKGTLSKIKVLTHIFSLTINELMFALTVNSVFKKSKTSTFIASEKASAKELENER